MTTVPVVAARAVVVMGVSGSGTTTVAVDLTRRLGWEFAEGDEHHAPADVEKMRAGIPRAPAITCRRPCWAAS
jgi:gluconokinase